MKIPVLEGRIARRLLVNFRADPETVQALLPAPFRPKLHQGYAIAGVCLIRLEAIRPAFSPVPWGIASENAAHRFAVIWQDADGQAREGVYIPRRDTGSWLNHLAGGRVFPGQHGLADFEVRGSAERIRFAMRSQDQRVEVRLRGQLSERLPTDSCFADLSEASAFFAAGSLGYSARQDSSRLDGLLLKTRSWHVEALATDEAYSSYYADRTLFPKGSISYDHTLLMRNIEHQWHAAEALESGPEAHRPEHDA